ncbi:MAG: terpene cyclase/mutase family protein [Acidobacteria bacterium]|nr:terpene cyclase/mutase family protein [Acidobacteriota bacterium]
MRKKFVSKVIGRLNVYKSPSHMQIIMRDSYGLSPSPHSDEDHLQAAMDWLCRAQDITGCGGVSAAYDLRVGWLPAYPETTGYIICTFLQHAAQKNETSYVERAIRMGDWEIEIQLPSGAVRGDVGVNDHPMVFDTGQVILGWTALYRGTQLDRFLEAAIKAADWLLRVQDPDGSWSQYALRSVPHTYHTKVAWSLMEVYRLTDEETYKRAAESNILWALAQARHNGWFRHMGFTLDKAPPTHTIAYTLQGLLEPLFYLEEDTRRKILAVIQTASENILAKCPFDEDAAHAVLIGLPGTLNEKWESEDQYACLTGNVQMAIVWLKLYDINHETRLLNAALKLIDQVKATQSLDSTNPGIRGAIAGSYPIWGGYIPYTYLNWSTKFFADALLLKDLKNNRGSLK